MGFLRGNWPKNRGFLKWLWRWFDGVEGAIPWAQIVASIPRRISGELASILL